MKKISVVLLIVLLGAYKYPPQNNFSAKAVEKSFGKIKEGLYVNKTEVSNLDYRTFLAALIEENKQELYNASLPDSTTWRGAYTYCEPYVDFYFRHPAYNNYPVVGISYENAVQYCQWLTDKYNSTEKRKFSKVLFRLPTKEEWELAANGGDGSKQYTWGSGFIVNNRKQQLCNYKIDDALYDSVFVKLTPESENRNARQIRKRKFIATDVKSYYPSSFGMYNMCGNVAEMIAEKGIVKGGSYTDPAWLVTIASEKNYTTATADIGFRVAMEVLEK
jgi:formylglycine-generating enzyme